MKKTPQKFGRVKESAYYVMHIDNDFYNLYVKFSFQISFKNANVFVKTFHKPFTTFAFVLYQIFTNSRLPLML